MVRASEIRDTETLREWLEGRPQTDAVAIAHRAALRVFPLWAEFVGSSWAHKADLTDLPVSRSTLTAGVYIGSPTPAVKTAARSARSAARSAALFTLSALSVADSAALSAADSAAFAADSARSADSAADSARSAADSARSAADSAALSAADSARSAARSAVWTSVSRDAGTLEDQHDCRMTPLWPGEVPSAITEAETAFLSRWAADPDTWDFWHRWWEGARDGKPLDWELQKRVALIPPEEWEKNDPARIAELIRGIEAEFHRGTALSRATPVDFTFDTIARIMRMVGLDDDTAHLRDQKVVQSFLDDCEELRDTFNDFMDYARELGGSPNRAGVLRRAAEKVCAELDRTRDKTHLRARYLVKLGRELELFAKEEAARTDLGPALAGTLDTGISLLRDVTRKHFGPAYTALAPLAQLTLDHIDQDAAVALLDQMIARLNALPAAELIALDDDGRAVFADMVREAHELRAALAEASSDEFRALLQARMAESIGGTGVAFGRFLERSAAAAGAASKVTDVAVKEYKKVETLQDILKFITDWLAGFGGSAG